MSGIARGVVAVKLGEVGGSTEQDMSSFLQVERSGGTATKTKPATTKDRVRCQRIRLWLMCGMVPILFFCSLFGMLFCWLKSNGRFEEFRAEESDNGTDSTTETSTPDDDTLLRMADTEDRILMRGRQKR